MKERLSEESADAGAPAQPVTSPAPSARREHRRAIALVLLGGALAAGPVYLQSRLDSRDAHEREVREVQRAAYGDFLSKSLAVQTDLQRYQTSLANGKANPPSDEFDIPQEVLDSFFEQRASLGRLLISGSPETAAAAEELFFDMNRIPTYLLRWSLAPKSERAAAGRMLTEERDKAGDSFDRMVERMRHDVGPP